MAFFRAIAYRIEEETGLLSQVAIDLSHEGFGWVLIFSGRLLLTSKTLRDAQRFGFASLEKLNEEGEKLVQKASISPSVSPRCVTCRGCEGVRVRGLGKNITQSPAGRLRLS
jgi:hypothetical protein